MKDGIVKCKKHGVEYDTSKIDRCLRCTLKQKEEEKYKRLLNYYE